MSYKENVLFKEETSEKYLTVGKMKELLSNIDNDALVLIANKGDFYIVNEVEHDSENDLVIRANTLFE